MERKELILIVDDQPSLCETLRRFLRRRGYRTASCTSANEALDYLAQAPVDLVLTDICMPEKTGMELLQEIQARGGDQAVVVMTAFATIDQGVEIMRRGASDYIAKPFRLDDVANIVEQALKRRRWSHSSDSAQIKRDSVTTQGRPPATNSRIKVVGQSATIRQLFTMVDRIAPTDSSVLITGATGTGKELIARQIHEKSARRKRPFVDINCSAIPATLIEAELFGHQRGSFTGADETRSGLFEEASSGTLFLDEVDALDLSSQAKLLRVLQERQIRRVGGRKNIPVDVRIISATNKNLHEAVARGTFRHDLLYRLCVVPLHVPELHERAEDIPLLLRYFLEQHALRRSVAPKMISEEAMKVLLNYHWPGNVRELENTIEYALAVGVDQQVQVEDLPPIIQSRQSPKHTLPFLQQCMEANATLSEIERQYVLLMLERHDGHQINTAAALGIDRRTLSRKLQQYGSRILNKEEHW